jgi:glycosyltransferase involved in cell wall biosynthesis
MATTSGDQARVGAQECPHVNAGRHPRATALLLTYNCEKYVGDALRSLLAQECEPLEVFISDDASTDGTLALIEKTVAAYDGPHEVTIARRSNNSGSKSAHLNAVVASTHGSTIVSFDGDDVYDPARVRRILECFDADPSTHAVYSMYRRIDEQGRVIGNGHIPRPGISVPATEWFAKVDSYAAGSTLAVRREVFTEFGPLPSDIAEDVVLPFRASLLGSVAFLKTPLVYARRRLDSLTASYDAYHSIDNYRRRFRQGVESARAKLASRLLDLDVACRLMPDRRDEFDHLRRLAHSSLSDAELSLGLVDRRAVKRISALLALLSRRAYRHDFPQNLAIALLPRLYLKHKRRQLGIGSEVAGPSSTA